MVVNAFPTWCLCLFFSLLLSRCLIPKSLNYVLPNLLSFLSNFKLLDSPWAPGFRCGVPFALQCQKHMAEVLWAYECMHMTVFTRGGSVIMAGLGYIQYGWTIITWTIWMYNNYMDKEVWLDWEWNPGHVKAGWLYVSTRNWTEDVPRLGNFVSLPGMEHRSGSVIRVRSFVRVE